jgi:hypothetical protein
VAVFVPPAGGAGDAEDGAFVAAAESASASTGGAFVPHAVPTLAAIIAMAITLVSNLEFKFNLDFILSPQDFNSLLALKSRGIPKRGVVYNRCDEIIHDLFHR